MALLEALPQLPQDMLRIFVKVEHFTPYYFDAPVKYSVEQILYLAKHKYVNSFRQKVPINIQFTKISQFTDGYVIIARDMRDVQKACKKPKDIPMHFDGLCLDEYWYMAYPADPEDFSVFQGKMMPGQLYLNNLIKLAADREYKGGVVRAVFLFYHEMWIDTAELIVRLVDLFHSHCPLKQPDSTYIENYAEFYYYHKIISTKLGVLELIYEWILYYKDDFQAAEQEQLKKFLATLDGTIFADYAAQILQILNQPAPIITHYTSVTCDEPGSDTKQGWQWIPERYKNRMQHPMFSFYLGRRAAMKIVKTSPIVFPDSIPTTFCTAPNKRLLQFYYTNNSLMDAEADQIASLIFFFLYETYINIHPREFPLQPYSKPETQHLCPYVNLHIRRFNIVSHWVASTCLKNVSTRGPYIGKVVEAANILRQNKHFEGAMALIAGLTMSAVDRTKCFDDVPAPQKQVATELRDLFGLGDNWQSYRRELNRMSSSECCVPVSSICLKDVFMIEEAQAKFEHGRAYFARGLVVWNTIHRFLRFYAGNFPPKNMQIFFNKKHYDELCSFKELSDDELFDLSYQVLPRGQGV